MEDISRRSFLTGAVAVAGIAATAGLAGCAPQTTNAGAADKTETAKVDAGGEGGGEGGGPGGGDAAADLCPDLSGPARGAAGRGGELKNFPKK